MVLTLWCGIMTYGCVGAHGYLLLMFNALRLLEDQGGSSYVVKSILENHPGWQALRPAIMYMPYHHNHLMQQHREKTKATVGFRIKPDSLNDLVGGMPGLPAHLAPRGPPRSVLLHLSLDLCAYDIAASVTDQKQLSLFLRSRKTRTRHPSTSGHNSLSLWASAPPSQSKQLYHINPC